MGIRLDVDSIEIQNTFRKLGDMLSDIGPGFDKVANDIAGASIVGVAYRQPANEQHLQVLDHYLKSLHEECKKVLTVSRSAKEIEAYRKAMVWIEAGYEDFQSCIKRVPV